MWSTINVRKSGPRISDPITRHDTHLNLFDINGTLAWKSCRSDFSCVLDPLPGWFPKGVLKHNFKGIQETTFFGINSLGHTEAIKVIFFWKFPKFCVDFQSVIKLRKDVAGFEDNCVWTCSWSFCQLWKE